ncbi:MAG: energy-coupling factor ABC transporter ATP-binding protein [Duodenibacillus sp.]|nr:energy-coupling factor ABC transporter ATP-binding protein [Duodenibacillus sp.]
MSGKHLLQVKNLSFGFERDSMLFDKASLTIHEEDQIGLWADNGTGKTTLLRIITGLQKAASMELYLNEKRVTDEQGFREVRRQFGFVLQNAEDQLFFPEVIDDVMFGPLNLGLGERQAREAALEALSRLGISQLAGADSFHLSGGQKRLVSIASILAMRPIGLLLDEPTTGLDAKARSRLADVLKSLTGPRLIVSHDMGFLTAVSNRLVSIEQGHFVPLNFPAGEHFS